MPYGRFNQKLKSLRVNRSLYTFLYRSPTTRRSIPLTRGAIMSYVSAARELRNFLSRDYRHAFLRVRKKRNGWPLGSEFRLAMISLVALVASGILCPLPAGSQQNPLAR